MATKRDKKIVIDAIVKGIQRNGERCFDISQQTVEGYVPVDTGFLKGSGFVERLKRGVQFGYRAKYASVVEHGIANDIPIRGNQIVHIKEHMRKGYTRRDGVYVPPVRVPAHDVVYKNKRLIPIREKATLGRGRLTFRVIDKIKARPGKFYLHRAFEKGVKELPNDIRFYLRQIGKVS